MPRVMVVDDTASIRMLIRTNLELAGFEVDEAVDGQACLDQLAEPASLPDAITVDVMMPRMDGFTAVEAIRADPRTAEIAVVMVTTQNHAADIARAAEVGVDHFLVKPFDPEELIAEVERAIATRSGSAPPRAPHPPGRIVEVHEKEVVPVSSISWTSEVAVR